MENRPLKSLLQELNTECPHIISSLDRAREICRDIENVLSEQPGQWVSLAYREAEEQDSSLQEQMGLLAG
jgi:transcription elongation GreA/GreB family factor